MRRKCIIAMLAFGGEVLFAASGLSVDVSGSIVADTVWTHTGSPYVVTGDLTVEPGAKLTISSNVTVQISTNFRFVVRGGIEAHGDEDGPVLFCAPAETNQGGFVELDGAQLLGVTGRFERCWFRCLGRTGSGKGAVHATNSCVEVTGCVFSNLVVESFRADASRIDVAGCIFTNTGGGVIVRAAAGSIRGNRICQVNGDSDGIDAEAGWPGVGDSRVFIISNVVCGAGHPNADGIDMDGCQVLCDGNVVGNFPDKGYSIGQGTIISIRNSLVYKCKKGVKTQAGVHADLANCTITDCSDEGVSCDLYSDARITMTNCIVWYCRTAFALVPMGGTFSLGYSCVTNLPSMGDVVGNITSAPGFYNRAAEDFSLLSNSPCIDAGFQWGVPDIALNGWRRPQDGDRDGLPAPDMGACEYGQDDLPMIWNGMEASCVGLTTAQVNAVLLSTGDSPAVVFGFMGGTDAGPCADGWTVTNCFGTNAADCPAAIGWNVSGLQSAIIYYYRFMASNGSGIAWAPRSSSVATLDGRPIMGDAWESGVTASSAYLRATMVSSGEAPAFVSVFWGETDGATSAGLWGFSNHWPRFDDACPVTNGVLAENLNSGTRYYFRSLATNRYGAAWSGVTRQFSTTVLLNPRPRRMKIRFNGYSKAGVLTNFPALVVLNNSIPDFNFGTFASAEGFDIRFWDADGTNLLDYEIEKWDYTGDSLIWVRIPALSGSNDFIWADWGQAADAVRLPCTTNGAAWDPSFVRVWHMGGTNAPDSTANQGHGVATGPVSNETPALIGDGVRFPGNDAALNMGTADDLNFNLSTSWSISFWVYPVLPMASACLYHRAGDNNSCNGGENYLYYQGGVSEGLCWGPINSEWNSRAVLSSNTWQLVTMTYEAGSRMARAYINGTQKKQVYAATVGSGVPGSFMVADNANVQFFRGAVDEMRITTAAVHSNWIWASWMNQASNSAFVSYTMLDPDEDMDGMPDVWEIGNFVTTNAENGAAQEDWDGDTVDNLDEYQAGTQPTNDGDLFEIRIVQEGTNAVVWFPARAAAGIGYAGRERVYFLDARGSLATGEWAQVPGYDSIAAFGAPVVHTNADQPSSYYRGRARLR